MTLKTATLIALIGQIAGYGLSIWMAISNSYLSAEQMVQSAIYNIPMMIFLFVLYRKQLQ